MKKIAVVMLAAVMLLVSCDLNSLFVKKSRIHINVKPLLYSEQLKSSASRAVLSFNEQTISVKAESEGMTTVETTLVYDSASGVFSGSIEVQKNTPVTFTVEAKDAKGTVYVKGSDTKTITKDTDNLAITMAPVLGETVKKEVEADFLANMETAEKGSVFTVAFAPVIPFDLTYAIESKDVSVAVCNKEGKNLLNAQQEWTMKKGEEVIILYTITAEDPMIRVYPKLVTVTFDANSGTGTMTPQTMNANVPTTLSPNTFTKDGYVFAAWCDALDPVEAGAIDYTSEHFILDQSSIAISSDITLYAQWLEVVPATISFDANGGDGSMDYIGAAVGDTVTLPQNSFTKTGHTFAYWLAVGYENLGPIHNGTDFFVPGDVTLVAQWTPNAIPVETVTITFDANGGTGSMSAQTMDANTATPLTKNTFNKDGWIFTGWNTAKEGTGTPYANAAEVSLNTGITLYAQWQENVVVIEKVTVTFDANGGTGIMSAQTMDANTTTPLTKNTFTKEGESFISWNTAKEGTGTTYADEEKVTLSNNLTLYAQYEYVALISVVVSNSEIYLATGAIMPLNYTLYPASSSNRNVTWTSSNEAVATVSASGEVTAVSSGIALITVTTEEGSKKDVCEVRVGTPVVSAESISLSSDNVSMETGSQLKLIATVVPENADNYYWSSSDESVALVKDGLVTALKAGIANVRVYSEYYMDFGVKVVEDICTITVTDPPVEGISLNKKAVSLVPGATVQLIASFTPSNVVNKNLTWVSDSSSVASVSDTGLVTASGAGTAVITVTSEEGSWTDTCNVTVQTSGVSIVFEGLTDESMDLSYDTGIVSKSNYNSITISYDGEDEYITWYVDNEIWTSGYTMYFYASNYAVGNHTITAIIEKGDSVYSKSVIIRVVE